MTDFAAMLKLKEPPRLTDEQVDELIASRNGAVPTDGRCNNTDLADAHLAGNINTPRRRVIHMQEVL